MIIKCGYCGETFERPLKHVNQNKKLGCKNYCSKKCRSKACSEKISGKKHPLYGKSLTKKTREKMRLARLGKKLSPETRERMRLVNLGKKLTSGTKKKISKTRKKLGLAKGGKNPMYGVHRYGKDSPSWKGGVTSKNTRERLSIENVAFIQEILKRDDYTCQACGLTSRDKYPDIDFFRKYKRVGRHVKIEVDHIWPWSEYPKLRHNLENVRTLCKPCHKEYGANPCCKPKKYATSPINRFFAKKESKENFVNKVRDCDPNLLEEGRDSLTDQLGNIHIFPIENMLEHNFNPKESEEICWCLPEIISEGICEECKEKHPPFLIYHSWVM